MKLVDVVGEIALHGHATFLVLGLGQRRETHHRCGGDVGLGIFRGLEGQRESDLSFGVAHHSLGCCLAIESLVRTHIGIKAILMR